ncbi:MAG: nitroreductase family protein, partial [Candidatus Omnitrophica bacterium]|nr:nitroreductase family protein [Candidatus Omnitrophota bacterium]
MKPMLNIDHAKCVKCGACVDVCPVKVIEKKPGDFPESVVWAPKACITCGHCVCVCPKGAISHKDIQVDKCGTVDEKLFINTAQVEQLLKGRRSIRVYKKDKIDRKVIEKLIDIARMAPTGHNLQQVKWKVVTDDNTLKLYKGMVIDWMKHTLGTDPDIAKKFQMKGVVAAYEAGIDIVLRDAPSLVITYASKDDRMALGASTIALSFLDVAAPVF